MAVSIALIGAGVLAIANRVIVESVIAVPG